MKLSLFTNPRMASATLGHDQGWHTTGFPDVYTGRPATSFTLPPGTPTGHGATLTLIFPGKTPIVQRGILWLNDGSTPFPWLAGQTAAFVVDDYYLQDAPPPCPEPPDPPDPPDPPQSEIAIVEAALAKYPSHAERVEMLKETARELNRAGFTGENGEPYGILKKTSGANCGGYSCDIVCAGNGAIQEQYDVLKDGPEPTWGKVKEPLRRDVCEIQQP